MVQPEIVDMIVSVERDKISRIFAKWGRGEELTTDDKIAYYHSIERLNTYRYGDPKVSSDSQREHYIHRAFVGMHTSTKLKFGLKRIFGQY